MGWATGAGPEGVLRRSDRGQVAAEYMGLLVVAAIVIAALVAGFARGPANVVAVDTQGAVCRVGQLGDCSSGAPSGSEGTGGGVPDVVVVTDEGCSGVLDCAWSGTKQVGSGVANVGKGAWDDAKGAVDVVTHPGQLVDAGKYIVSNPGDAAKELVWDSESGDMWSRGDYGGAIGRTTWNVGSWFIPGVDAGKAGAKLGKFGKLGKLAEEGAKASRLADDAGSLARKAEEAAARGDTAEASRLAEQAQAKADEAEEAAHGPGCPVALGGGGRVPAAAPFYADAGCDKAKAFAERAAFAARKAHEAVWNSLPQSIRDLTMSHVTNTGDTVLGHFPKYITKSNARGASYFDLGDAWNGLTPEQAWSANLHFLDATADRGDRILLSVPKSDIADYSYLVNEVDYLTKEKGYTWVNQWSLKPP